MPIKAFCFLMILSSSALFSQSEPDSVNCEELFKKYYTRSLHPDSLLHFDKFAIEKGMRGFLFNVKFHYVNRCHFLDTNKAIKEIHQLASFLHENKTVSVKLIIYNWWLTPEHSNVLACQTEVIENLLLTEGIDRNRFDIQISREGFRIVERKYIESKIGFCKEGLPPYTFLNSWLDVRIRKN